MLRTLSRCIARATADTVAHDGIEHAGYLAFLGLLALFPFLVFVVSVLGAIGPETPLAHDLSGLFSHLSPEIIHALQPRIEEITSGPPQGLLTIAIIGAIWTASSAVEGLRTILNRAYRVHTPPRYILRRSLSVLQLLVFAFSLIVGMALIVTIPALMANLERTVGLDFLPPESAARYWSRAIYYGTPLFLLLVVAWIYYAVPNIRQRWLSVWPGAVVSVVLWLGAAWLFQLYLSHFNQLTLIYGGLGGIIAALIFFYVCNVIFIFGAELNHQIAEWAGMKVEEREKA